ncbi:MAG: hypothetical protein LCH88_10410 [Proteobacteria bacterium]|nr:hypothetical protein [Pseudomonadota bacterium]
MIIVNGIRYYSPRSVGEAANDLRWSGDLPAPLDVEQFIREHDHLGYQVESSSPFEDQSGTFDYVRLDRLGKVAGLTAEQLAKLKDELKRGVEWPDLIRGRATSLDRAIRAARRELREVVHWDKVAQEVAAGKRVVFAPLPPMTVEDGYGEPARTEVIHLGVGR